MKVVGSARYEPTLLLPSLTDIFHPRLLGFRDTRNVRGSFAPLLSEFSEI